MDEPLGGDEEQLQALARGAAEPGVVAEGAQQVVGVAGAGVAGAAEVKALALYSAKATLDIITKIEAIQQDTDAAVEVIGLVIE